MFRMFVLVGTTGVIALGAILLLVFWEEIHNFGTPSGKGDRLKVAIVGDSDSHSYRDSVHGIRRGGDFHEVTLNWVEVWARLRGDEVSFGSFGYWGSRLKVARLRALLGLHAKTPRKEDFKFNYSFSGAGCQSISNEWHFQGDWLLNTVSRSDWNDGLAVIRLGVNDFGQRSHLIRWSQTGYAAEASAVVQECTDAIEKLVLALRSRSRVRIAIVGIAHDYNSYETFETWPSHEEITNMHDVLSAFDAKLVEIAQGDDRTIFVDDRRWLTDRIGDRLDETYTGEFKFLDNTVRYGPTDHPLTIMIADGHASTLSSALWLQHFIRQVNDAWSLGLTDVKDAEISSLIDLGDDTAI